ncbi:hypothetical protein [Burkholderia multivorans]|uniref:hypothetical protein n=1 Tax=Burkholderia multivorans TaxID=87883 RepID=UPI00338E9D27
MQEVKGLGWSGISRCCSGRTVRVHDWAVIATPVGTMRGAYFCVAEDGERFEAPTESSRCTCRARCTERTTGTRP